MMEDDGIFSNREIGEESEVAGNHQRNLTHLQQSLFQGRNPAHSNSIRAIE